ncbi:MAG: protein kinase [Candidatus Brocadiae bacterium]|nr:protein kinase [Candidatus Brocadiia bacterium]
MKAKLNITTKENPQTITRVVDTSEAIHIGRSPLCNVPVADKKLSRVHCILYYEKDSFFIKDNQSTNGTFLNKHQLQQPEKVRHGDVLRMGDTKIDIFLEDEDSQEVLDGDPKKIDDYEVVEKIGGGGIGVVYKVIHGATKALFAIKLLKPEAASDNTMVTRFLKEARACARLNHPGLMKVHDIGIYQAFQSPYLVLEYVPGKTLADIIYEKDRIELPQALKITLQLSDALEYAHKSGIIHRDIKPANILLTPDFQAKLVDMGMVKMLNECGITLSGQTLGTPRYMPPEQIEDAGKVDQSADIYGLGATLYHMLAGIPPYNEIRSRSLGELLQHITTVPPLPIQKFISLPVEVLKLLEKMMARDKKNRFANASLVNQEIKKLIPKG